MNRREFSARAPQRGVARQLLADGRGSVGLCKGAGGGEHGVSLADHRARGEHAGLRHPAANGVGSWGSGKVRAWWVCAVRAAAKVASVAVLILGTMVSAVEGGKGVHGDVEALWRGVDVRALPLKTTVLGKWTTEGIVTRKVMFTSHRREEVAVRILAFYSAPTDGGKHAGVLHIHGGGQTANRDYTEYFARHGFAALSINWGGVPLSADGGNSDWGRFFVAQSDNGKVFRVLPEPRENPWFQWAIACRRGLTFLEQQPEADAARLGIFGVSMGGQLTWIVAGADERVKAAVSIYGAVNMTERIAGIAGSEQLTLGKAEAEVWRRTLDGAAYALRMRAPFLYLSAANDFYGAMDLADAALATIPGAEYRQAFTPHFNHHVEPEQSRDLLLWMERWLKGTGPRWPRTLELWWEKAGTGGGVPVVTLVTDKAERAGGPDEVTAVAVYYTTDPYPQSRFWRTATVTRVGDVWTSSLPLMVRDRGLWAYANVTYRSGVSLSTRVLAVSADELGKAGVRATELRGCVIEDFARGSEDWFVPEVGVNPLLNERAWFRRVEGPEGKNAIVVEPVSGRNWRMATRKIGDPQWSGAAGDGLRLRVRTEEANTLVVVATENERRRPGVARTYVAHAQVKGGGWEDVSVPLAAFREATSGAALASWERVNLLAVQGDFAAKTGKNAMVAGVVAGPWRGRPPVIAVVEWATAEYGTREEK